MEIRNQFTAWLGQNQRVAIDPETGEEYRWDDVLIFDQAISEADQSILRRAISERQIIREAIFLFSRTRFNFFEQYSSIGSMDK